MMSTVSPLPKAMQSVRADHLAAANGAGTVVPAPTPTPPADPVPSPESATPAAGTTDAPALPPAPEERVTLTRAEFNELQASKAGTARLEAANLRIEEMQQRLTELETAAKGKPHVEEPPRAPLLDVGEVSFTEDEERDFGESREFVGKVVKQHLAALVAPLEERLSKLEQGVQSATNSANRVAQTSFQSQVYTDVPDLNELIRHQHWADFLDTREEFSGETFETVLGNAIRSGSVERTKKVYDTFRKQYIGDKPAASTTAAGYAGAVPSGAATVEPPDQQPAQKMKMSERKKISEDYRKGRISWEKKEEFDKKFVEAEKNGNVDYDA